MSTRMLQAVLLAASLCAAAIDATAQPVEEIPTSEAIRIFTEIDRPSDLSDENVATLDRRHSISEHFVQLDAAALVRAFNTGVPRPYQVSIHFAGDAEFDIVVEEIENLTPSGARINGHVSSDDLSQLSIVISPLYVTGNLQTSTRTFEFLPMQDGISVMVEIDHRRYPRERDPGAAHRRPEFDTYPHPPTVATSAATGAFVGPEPIDGVSYAETDDVSPELRVLVLASQHEFTCDDNWNGDMAGAYSTDLDKVFDGYLTTRVTFKCVDVPEDWSDIVEAHESISMHAEFANWRKDAEADVVVLLLADGMGYCGYSLGPDYPDYPINGSYHNFFAEYAALSVVAEECALGNKSLAHEIGHLFGMKHERFSERGGVSNFCGYGYPIMLNCEPVARTIMAYDSYCTFVNGVTCKRASTLSIPSSDTVASIGGIFGTQEIKGQTCTSTERDHLGASANNTYQLTHTAADVAGYWELFSQGLP